MKRFPVAPALQPVGRRAANPIPQRAIAMCAFVALLAVPGCHPRTHKDIRADAESDWSRLRSDLKHRLASQQLESGRIDEAIKTLKEAARLHPSHTELYRLLAKCHLERDEVREANQAVRHATQLNDTSADLAYTRGLIHEHQGRYAAALEAFYDAAAIDPNNIDYLAAVAETYVTLGQPDRALALLKPPAPPGENSSPLDTLHDPELVLLRAGIHAMLGHDRQAAEDYEALINMVGAEPWLVRTSAWTLMRLGRYTDALALLTPLLNGDAPTVTRPPAPPGDPPPPDIVRAAAECQIRSGNPGPAVRLLEQHLDEHPKDARAWWLLAEAALATGDTTTANRCLRKGRRIAPDLDQWDVLDAYLLYKRGDTDLAIQALNRATANDAPHAELRIANSE